MSETNNSAAIIWEYLRLDHTLTASDCLLVLGSNDIRVAQYAAVLYQQKYAPFVIFAGGLGRLTQGVFTQPEACVFAQIALANGLNEKDMLLETRSTNTGENILFSQTLIEQNAIPANRLIILTKPYLTRRAYATGKLHWPEKEIIVSSPTHSFYDYTNEVVSHKSLLKELVGEIDRLRRYPQKGFHIFQDIPDAVMQAYFHLTNSIQKN